MDLKELDQTLLKYRKILKEKEIPFALSCSTLLGIYRDGKQCAPNRSVDLVCRPGDLTDKKIKDLKPMAVNQVRVKRGLMYFKGMELQPVYFVGGHAVYNMANDHCLIYPAKHFKKWDSITYLGKKWNIPHDPEAFLEVHYGKNWRTPLDKWDWQTDCKSITREYDEISRL